MSVAQLQTINKVLSTNDYSLINDNCLNLDYFPDYKSEFKFINNHYTKYGTLPDLVTFVKSFPDFEVLDVRESTNYLVSELIREKNEAFLTTTFNKMRDLLIDGKTDAAMNLFRSESQKSSANSPLKATDILSDISRYDSYIDKCNDFNKYYLSTGFKELDNSLGGGIDRQNAYFVISARAGIGKTLVMVKFATAAVEKGLNVGFYEGEMTVDKIAGRFDTLVSHISNSAITHGNIGVANNYKQYLDNLQNSSKGKFYILTRDTAGSDKITVDVLRTFVEKYNLDILFVDQLSLLDSHSYAKHSFEQAAEISKALKNLQVQKHIPIIVASQQNRTSLETGELAGTQNLSLSDRIGQDATEVLFLTKEDNIMKMNIAKARDGCSKYVLTYEVDFDKGIFNYLADEDDDPYSTQISESPVSHSYSGKEVF